MLNSAIMVQLPCFHKAASKESAHAGLHRLSAGGGSEGAAEEERVGKEKEETDGRLRWER